MACNLLLDEGWGYTFSAPHHDAVYMHVPVEKAEDLARTVQAAFVFAGKQVMASSRDPEFAERFPLRIKAKVTPSPEHYVDDDGADIWKIVCEYFGWDGHTKQQLRRRCRQTGESSTILPSRIAHNRIPTYRSSCSRS
jgi:hypothetical protein